MGMDCKCDVVCEAALLIDLGSDTGRGLCGVFTDAVVVEWKGYASTRDK